MLATGNPTPQNEMVNRLDSAVSEVFEMMLERSCDPMDGDVHIVDGRIVARIQFTGAVSGECILYASPATAAVTAEAMLGTASSEPCDPMVDDAIGELCNMIAGGWKSKLEHPQAGCLISVPAVTREGLVALEGKFGTKFSRTYSFQGNIFGIVLAF
ncbi:chemotaxis protein CheX [Edaphobacter paludis]|uniref:Chemotaxis protein CheX n=1 Tax=Edaphobacter paludis TaxID=3035702 RepID=A0AAU7D290_9BACT